MKRSLAYVVKFALDFHFPLSPYSGVVAIGEVVWRYSQTHFAGDFWIMESRSFMII